MQIMFLYSFQRIFTLQRQGSFDMFYSSGFRAQSPQTPGVESNRQHDILHLSPRIQKCKCSICPTTWDLHKNVNLNFSSGTNNKDGCEYLGAKSIWFETIMKTCVQAHKHPGPLANTRKAPKQIHKIASTSLCISAYEADKSN